MIRKANEELRLKIIFWGALLVTIASGLIAAERLFTETRDVSGRELLLVTGLSWGAALLYRSAARTAWSVYFYPAVLLSYFKLIMHLEPFPDHAVWVYLPLFPLIAALGLTARPFWIWTSVYAVFYGLYAFYEAPAVLGGHAAYLVLFLISTVLGRIIVHKMDCLQDRFRESVISEKNTFVLALFENLIPTVEQRTQVPRSEIRQMALMLHGMQTKETPLQWWEADFIAHAHYASRLALPDYLYEKKGALSDQEQLVVQEHVHFAVDMMPAEERMQNVRAVLLQHHERIDGSGYPHALTEREIDERAQMLGLIETYLSMRNGRAYRAPMTEADAVRTVCKELDGKLNGRLLRTFQENMKKQASA
ncbi:HD-GYP domain-containing protein [Bacillus daqingensis]|uniref:HD-GYP domain-containing protein n=1 Tax=Bacillus daqingensis TaxID=872396 RepID=A0ABV9NWD0_9BACI